jgi:spore coat protein CotF
LGEGFYYYIGDEKFSDYKLACDYNYNSYELTVKVEIMKYLNIQEIQITLTEIVDEITATQSEIVILSNGLPVKSSTGKLNLHLRTKD